MVRLCKSTVLSDRREGLNSIQDYLRSSRLLNHAEITQLLEAFNRLFYDPNNKVRIISMIICTLHVLFIFIYNKSFELLIYALF